MIVGHAPFAFALLAIILLVTTSFSNKKVLYLATVAGTAALLPDIDILFPLVSLISVTPFTISELVNQFWTVSGERHRLATHSLIILGSGTILAFAQMHFSEPTRKYSILLATLAVFLLPLSLAVQLLTATIFTSVYILITRKPDSSSINEITLAFSFGAFIHPFGDMFTGTPPAFFYPFTNIIGLSRWTIADSTIQFGLVFILEIGSLIAALYLLAHLTETTHITLTEIKPKPHHTIISTLIIGTLLFILGTSIAPTVDSAPPFVFPLVGATLISSTPALIKRRFVQYVGDVSWTLLFAVIIFTLTYILLNTPF